MPLDYNGLFRNCSLVAKSWVYPSHRRLFETIGFRSEARFWSWLKSQRYGSPQHVRSLRLEIDNRIQFRERSIDLARFFNNDCPLFPQLRRLSLWLATPSSIHQFGMAMASQPALEYLALEFCTVTINLLVTLVNRFPNLSHLKLCCLDPGPADNDPILPLSRPLRKLSVCVICARDDLDIIGQFLELQPRCSEVSIDSSLTPSLTQRIIDCVSTTVRCLSLKADMERECGMLILQQSP